MLIFKYEFVIFKYKFVIFKYEFIYKFVIFKYVCMDNASKPCLSTEGPKKAPLKNPMTMSLGIPPLEIRHLLES